MVINSHMPGQWTVRIQDQGGMYEIDHIMDKIWNGGQGDHVAFLKLSLTLGTISELTEKGPEGPFIDYIFR